MPRIPRFLRNLNLTSLIGKGEITNEMLGDSSVRSNNIGSGSVKLAALNSEVKTKLDKTDQIDDILSRLKALEDAPKA
ncbi:tail fiber protein [Bacillus phage vB_BspS_SplendidRed]|uniref:Putative collagen like protein n=1 Tax=Bacillus phage vB_BspS_SplendidRed TaxID=2591379 RepID=A0A5B9NLA3_9CAUD|nr:tail fiber protein [Bacillus phage vB_BspS_SplendidRed]QEG13542.1 putative collagen like protein [Bacillus phage vB_BspS_SplendidRed]